TEIVRRKPYCVLLLDEIEKAHPDTFNLLLQILDDGQLTDAKGRKVNFKNTIIIMTSNIGSPHLLDGVTAEGVITEGARAAVMAELRREFRPEFLNRVDDVVLFKPLSRSEIKTIIELLVIDLRKRLVDRHIDLELTDAARDFIAKTAYDPVYGARPLKRYLQHQLETKIGRALLAGTIGEGMTVTVGVDAGGLTVATG
ncbi:MAG TPA: type VI secretion system ATPase TssH, partial [Desulfuromonas sp.]|nr:type VI secretion system ATPase TssH [Desulfuromonas sp.]